MLSSVTSILIIHCEPQSWAMTTLITGGTGKTGSRVAHRLNALGHPVRAVSRHSEPRFDWYDDSKGTNVGATIAALNGLARPTILILGGEGKGQDFSPLAAPVARYARRVLLIGRDAPILERALAAAGVPLERCATLEAAVARGQTQQLAARIAARAHDAKPSRRLAHDPRSSSVAGSAATCSAHG